MTPSNYLMALDLLISVTEYSVKLAAVIREAESEDRDIYDAEIAALRDSNLAKIDELLSK
jgi:hypothetical protein